MPNASAIRSPAVFGGLPQDGVLASEYSSSSIPVGFDAVAQCDEHLVRIQIARNLHEAGAARLSARVAYAGEVLPGEVRAAAAPHLRPHDFTGLDEIAIELRLLEPTLVTLSAGPGPPPSGLVEVTWTLELNLLRIKRDMVLTAELEAPPSTGSGPAGGVLAGGGVLALPDGPAGGASAGSESRVRLGAGRAFTTMPAHVVTRAELLQAWLELDVASTETTTTADDPPLTALLESPRGQEMLRTTLAKLLTCAGLRASPRIAIAGSLAPQQVAALGLPPMRAVHTIHRRNDGREVLSLCFSFGDDSAGSRAGVEPFLGANHFALYVSLATLAPVVQARWQLRPAAREYVSDVPVEMPLHEGSEERGEGLARLRVRLGGELYEVGLTALEGEHGDVLQLAFDEEVQLLAAWYADGSEVGDLGELGEAATFPLVVNLAPFTPAPPNETLSTPLRDLLLSVLEPLALPMLERFTIHHVDGFLSEALGAVVGRWALPTRQQDITGGMADVGVIGR